ncbi:hypothetical protein PSCLAVI8L_80110 [Pseudoclavibacter sp. 8L]|nr:hypothetical protein PSCLAVI8L_80110 [Pseudoclavibacter sp. 8L]
MSTEPPSMKRRQDELRRPHHPAYGRRIWFRCRQVLAWSAVLGCRRDLRAISSTHHPLSQCVSRASSCNSSVLERLKQLGPPTGERFKRRDSTLTRGDQINIDSFDAEGPKRTDALLWLLSPGCDWNCPLSESKNQHVQPIADHKTRF